MILFFKVFKNFCVCLCNIYLDGVFFFLEVVCTFCFKRGCWSICYRDYVMVEGDYVECYVIL